MIPLSLAEIAGVVGGEVHDADPVLLVAGPAFLDSRQPEPGGLFAAFAGEHVDGHEYADRALAGGAAAVLGSRATGLPTVVVPDVQDALQALAHEVLARRRAQTVPLTVVAITGSQGKTSAKDMLAAVLADAAPTVATHGSFNNELGLPLTVLRVTSETRHLVLEMGARGIGHLRELTAIARPDVSLVLNVGRAHIGEFGSRENIALAKGELVEALQEDGTAVLNADDDLVRAMASRTRATVTTFGRAPGSDVQLADVHLDDLGRASFTLAHGGEPVPVSLRLLGAHQAANAAAVAATALACGLRLDAVADSLGSITALSKWRMQLLEGPDGLVVVNDAYNANPDSTAAALDTLAAIAERSGRRGVAVLGEMRELGESAADEHRAVGAHAARLGLAVLAVGGDAPDLGAAIRDGALGAGGEAAYADTRDAALAWLREKVSPADVVLVKASRGAALESVAEALAAVPVQEAGPDRKESHG